MRGLLFLISHLCLIESGHEICERVMNTLIKVDRAFFYNSHERVIIDAPASIEELKNHLLPGSKVLDVGSGSGYLTICMALMVEPDGVAYGIEHIPQLVKTSIENIKNAGFENEIINKKVIIIEGDGRNGLPEYAPFDAIHVGAAAEKIPENLKIGGRMLIPVGGRDSGQEYLIIDRTEDGRKVSKLTDVVYVPLTDKDKQVKL